MFPSFGSRTNDACDNLGATVVVCLVESWTRASLALLRLSLVSHVVSNPYSAREDVTVASCRLRVPPAIGFIASARQ